MKIYKIKESELSSLQFPICVCVYQYNHKSFSMVEINTGLHKGSIKVVSDIYSSYDELKKSYNIYNTHYPILFDHIIYNNISCVI